jgi:hypothetical protein
MSSFTGIIGKCPDTNSVGGSPVTKVQVSLFAIRAKDNKSGYQCVLPLQDFTNALTIGECPHSLLPLAFGLYVVVRLSLMLNLAKNAIASSTSNSFRSARIQ